jgi:hypothetical protein
MPKPTLPPKRPILWASNSATAGTGYGVQTAQVVSRLHRAGYPTAIASNYGQEGTIGEWDGIKVLPRGFDQYSNDVIGAYHQLWAAENGGRDPLVITLFDVWVYGGKPWEAITDVASWVPIDHTPCPPKVADWLRRPNVHPIAMSKFGAEQMGNLDIECYYAPHALDKVFAPTDAVKRPDGRVTTGQELLGFGPDEYVIMIQAANKGTHPAAGRKSWDTNLLAVSMMMQTHDDVRLFLHTERDGSMGGVNLPSLLAGCGIPESKVHFTDQFAYRMGLPQEALAAMSTAADVLLAVATGEGFGVPVAECQATGTPVIVGNWTASPELVADGWIVDGQPCWDPMQGAWWMMPNIPSTLEALEAAYQRGKSGPSQKAIDGMREYDADVVFNTHWKPILKALA